MLLESLVEHFHRSFLELFFNAVECVVDDAFGGRLLAVDHQVVHEFTQNAVAKFGVRQYLRVFQRRDDVTCNLFLTSDASRRISNDVAYGL